MHRKDTSGLKEFALRAELGFWHAVNALEDAVRGFELRAFALVALLVAALTGGTLASLALTREPATKHNDSLPLPKSVAAAHEHGYRGRHAGSPAIDWTPSREPSLPRHHRDYVVVRPGDTLWSIAAKYLHDKNKWVQLWEKNKDHIKNPGLIFAGELVYL